MRPARGRISRDCTVYNGGLPALICAPHAEQKRASLLIDVPQFLQKTAMGFSIS
jgi:hypothetical protein